MGTPSSGKLLFLSFFQSFFENSNKNSIIKNSAIIENHCSIELMMMPYLIDNWLSSKACNSVSRFWWQRCIFFEVTVRTTLSQPL